jgi:maltokinase
VLLALAPLLRDWLPRQRWFAGKDRPISGIALVSATELLPADGRIGTPGLLHLLVEVRQAAPGAEPGGRIDGDAARETAECYQLLLGARPSLPSAVAPAGLLGRARGGPLDGLTIYEAGYDPGLAALLLERLRTPGHTGALRFERAPGSAEPPAGLTPRLLGREQSNTSLVYGDSYILKLFRRVAPGPNPDLELSLALAATGSSRAPEPAAWFEAVGPFAEPATLGVLQRFLPGSRDAWQLALEAIAARADFTDRAAELGRATAEAHLALAAALPGALLTGDRITALADAMAARLEAAADAVPALRPYRSGLRAAYREFGALGGQGVTLAAQRVHGDLHLGQILDAPGRGWVLIDFEGEPSRPLAERRRPAPPVQDVAGMLRSFDYAAAHAAAEPGDPVPAWALSWAEAARSAFCAGYAAAAGHDPRDEPAALRAYETDKAVYEVVYEARHRPGWTHIPLAAVRRLAEPTPPRPRRTHS